jgi:hypothetical protein
MPGLRGLGQDDVDDFGPGEIITGGEYSDPSFANYDAWAASGAPSGGASSSWDTTAATPTGIIPVFNNPSVSPINPTQGIATTYAAATSPTLSPVLTYNAAGMPVAASSLTSMLPWLALGLGGIALFAAMGKRR